jgi:homoserine O-acetyltransferase/O-succinyltransferase
MRKKSVGLVTPRIYTFGNAGDPLRLESGETLATVDICYETYGEPNEDRSNGILVLHALSGDAHAAGHHHPHDRRTGWWEDMIGPGRAFDTDRYWIICSNVIGGCKGSTGPGSIDTATGQPFGVSFPMLTVGDMVDAQKRLIDHLGIERLHAVAGGSFGGFQVLEWALRYPHMVRSAIVIASSSKLSAQGIAFNAVGRHAITNDPGWMNGAYYGTPGPVQGLAIARMIGHITYLSVPSMDSKFGRRLQSADRHCYDFTSEFAIETYLHHQGYSFTERFDANSYLYITRAMDYFDISESYGPLDEAFKDTAVKYLVVSYSSDWLFPTPSSREIVRAILANDGNVTFIEISSPFGHDAFLLEYEQLSAIVTPFLETSGDYSPSGQFSTGSRK